MNLSWGLRGVALVASVTIGSVAGGTVGYRWAMEYQDADGLSPSKDSAQIVIAETAKAGGIGALWAAISIGGIAAVSNTLERYRIKAENAGIKAENAGNLTLLDLLGEALIQNDTATVIFLEQEIKKGYENAD